MPSRFIAGGLMAIAMQSDAADALSGRAELDEA